MEEQITKAQLERWAQQQRRDYKLGKLTRAKIAKLEEIRGWTWETPANPKDHYSALGQWKGWQEFLGNPNICDECGNESCGCTPVLYYRQRNTFGFVLKGEAVDESSVIGAVYDTRAEADRCDVNRKSCKITDGHWKGKYWAHWERYEFPQPSKLDYLVKREIPPNIFVDLDLIAADAQFQRDEQVRHGEQTAVYHKQMAAAKGSDPA